MFSFKVLKKKKGENLPRFENGFQVFSCVLVFCHGVSLETVNILFWLKMKRERMELRHFQVSMMARGFEFQEKLLR